MRVFVILVALLFTHPVIAQSAEPLPSIADKTADMERMDGLLPIYWDAQTGKLWLEIPDLGAELLYVVALPSGLGSNDVGLDRGQLGGERVVRFERIGPKVLLVAPNLRYRADTNNPDEAQAVEDAFAPAVVWGFTAGAETGGRVLVDATDFVVRDAHGVIDRLKATNQGTFRLDASRSAVHRAMTKAFPKNVELEAWLTFTSDDPGGYVRSVAADPAAVTLRVRHSFVALPEPGYVPRPFHPRSGYFPTTYDDYAVPIGEDLTQRFVTRHRLQCAGPPDADGLCTPVEPIVYYLDRGTPEPVRSALLDGARWWADAFTAAGFRDAFRVEMMPHDADPLDVRYNVIQWVHRSTRGWSYGASVTDPRTGEILKGHVSLGSLRVRQDYLLAEGLLAPYTDEAAEGPPPEDDPMLQMALARIRQLSAHEIGHTIGLAHNFAASADGRASVMDYPAPLATVGDDGKIDLSAAYDTGVGAWDVLAVRYGYTDFAARGTDPAEGRARIIVEMDEAGLAYLTDRDARPAGGAHPAGHLWDNGADAVDALAREMAVREVALARFGLATIRPGRPLALLEEVLVPLYLRHRYQVEATVKLVGGVHYAYALRGEAARLEPVAAATQRAALDALLATLTPETLALPPSVRTLLPPRPPGYPDSRELFGGYTGLTFDPYAPAETAASLVLGLILHPERAARLVYQADAEALPSLTDVLGRVDAAVWDAPQPDAPYEAELQRVVQQVWTDVLVSRATRADLAPPVRARLHQRLDARLDALRDRPGRDPETTAHRALLSAQIARFLNRTYEAVPERAMPTTPPGSPIGSGEAAAARQQTRQTWLDRHTGMLRCVHDS